MELHIDNGRRDDRFFKNRWENTRPIKCRGDSFSVNVSKSNPWLPSSNILQGGVGAWLFGGVLVFFFWFPPGLLSPPWTNDWHAPFPNVVLQNSKRPLSSPSCPAHPRGRLCSGKSTVFSISGWMSLSETRIRIGAYSPYCSWLWGNHGGQGCPGFKDSISWSTSTSSKWTLLLSVMVATTTGIS